MILHMFGSQMGTFCKNVHKTWLPNEEGAQVAPGVDFPHYFRVDWVKSSKIHHECVEAAPKVDFPHYFQVFCLRLAKIPTRDIDLPKDSFDKRISSLFPGISGHRVQKYTQGTSPP